MAVQPCMDWIPINLGKYIFCSTFYEKSIYQLPSNVLFVEVESPLPGLMLGTDLCCKVDGKS